LKLSIQRLNQVTESNRPTSFGSLLKAILNPSSLSQRQLAIRVGVGPDHISKIVNNRVDQPRLDLCQKIIEVLKSEGLATHSLEAYIQPVETKKISIPENSLSDSLLTVTQTEDLDFVGREEVISQLWELANRGIKLIEIQALGGVGKTTVAEEFVKLLQERKDFDAFISWKMSRRPEYIASAEKVLEDWMQLLGEEPSRGFNQLLNQFDRCLRQKKILLLIDNLEPALKGVFFLEQFKGYQDIFRILSERGAQSLTITTTREPLNDPTVSAYRFFLPDLSYDAWKKYFEQSGVHGSPLLISKLHSNYSGNAKCLSTIVGEILCDFNGSLDSYSQEYGSLLLVNPVVKDLFSSQLERLEQTDPISYNLLLRMSCYRFQGFLSIKKEALHAMLWDYENREMETAIWNVRQRRMLEFRSDSYIIHPIIHEMLREKLSLQKELWKKCHIKAAQHWSRTSYIQKIKDILQLLEAVFHFVEIKEYLLAARVFLKQVRSEITLNERNNSLSVFCYDLGLMSESMSISETLLENCDVETSGISEIELFRLYNSCGSMRLNLGDLDMAHTLFRKQYGLAFTPNSFDIKHEGYHLCVSFGCIALCYLDQWELRKALDLLIKANEISLCNPNLEHLASVDLPLSLMLELSIDPNNQKAKQTLYKDSERIYPENLNLQAWDIVYRPLYLARAFLYIGDLKKALIWAKKAVKVGEEFSLEQGKAKAFSLHQEIYRAQGDFSQSLEYASWAIKCQSRLQAKADLAESYFFQALAYRDFQKNELANSAFQKSYNLYLKINAPKQIERISQKFHNT